MSSIVDPRRPSIRRAPATASRVRRAIPSVLRFGGCIALALAGCSNALPDASAPDDASADAEETTVVDSGAPADTGTIDAPADSGNADTADAAETCVLESFDVTVTGYDTGDGDAGVCTFNSKIVAVARTTGGLSYFDGGPYDGPTGAHGARASIPTNWGECACNCAWVDVAISSTSGALEMSGAGRPLGYYAVSVPLAELLWQYRFGTTPDIATYSSEAWRQHLLAMFDCSPYARAGATCTISHVIPPGTFTPTGPLTSVATAVCGHFAAILRSP